MRLVAVGHVAVRLAVAQDAIHQVVDFGVERVMVGRQAYLPGGTIHLLVGRLEGLEISPANTLRTLRAENVPVADVQDLRNASPNPIPWSLG